MKKLMILGASELQVPAIECANRLGVRTIVLDYDKNAVGRNLAYRFYEISTLNYESILNVAKKEMIDGIMTICSDRPMPIIAKIGEQLGLNTISYETALKATDKGLMRNALRKNNVPIPDFFVCKNYEEFKNAIHSIKGKCIIKPSNNSGSRGIYLYGGNNDLKKIYEYSVSFSSDNCVLVEEYMEGPEVSVEAFVIGGKINIIQITDKITTGAPYFVEMGHTQPSSLPINIIEDIKETAVESIKAIGIDRGPAHVEIIVTKEGAKIVEIGSRLGGDHITTDLVPLSTGINMVELACKDALNMPVTINHLYQKSSAIRYFDKNYELQDKLKGMVILYSESMSYKEIMSSNDRCGYFIIDGCSLETVNNKIAKIESMLKESVYG